MLKKNLIRYRLITRHMELTRGTMDDLAVAREILYLLNHGKAAWGLDDVGCRAETEAEKAGVTIRYSHNYNVAYARL